MADEFTTKRARWLSRIAHDHDVSAVDFRVAFLIGGHINRKSGDAWPTQETIARLAGLKVRAVRNAIGRLADAGYLSVNVARGRGYTNRYSIKENRHDDAALSSDQDRHDDAAFSQDENRHAKTGLGKTRPAPRSTKTGTAIPENRHGDDNKTGTTVPTEPIEEPFEEPLDEPIEGKQLAKTEKSRNASKRNSSLPDNCPNDHDIVWARDFLEQQNRFDLVGDLDNISARFQDHHRAKHSTFRDWSAAWRTWLRNELRFRKPDNRYAGGPMSGMAGTMTGNLRRGGW